jgi:predicted metalloprotease with PDZ domain
MMQTNLTKLFLSFLIVVLLSGIQAIAKPAIHYTLSMPEPHTHYFEVEMHIQGIKQKTIDLKMPAWAPGSYLIREFARNVEDFKAISKGDELAATKTTKNTWRVTTGKNNEVTIRYKVYANELSVRTSFLDASHGFVSGTSVFMFIPDHTSIPLTLTVEPFHEWKKVSTALPQVPGKKWTFKAENYDILADAPIEIGNHQLFEFTAGGIPHQVAMYGEGNYDPEKIKQDLKKIAEACIDMFGENPNKNYLFIIHNLNKGSGGLEHLNSTTLQVNRWTYAPEQNYLSFLSLATHEYFHLYNVKRIRPITLGPFDYDNENYTRLLWVMEGFTSYYDELLLVPAGLAKETYFLNALSGSMTAIDNQPGNLVHPLAESSFDAWIKAYRPDENSYNSSVSYYTKGSVIAALLDLEIIHASQGKYCLDDVMRYLYAEYYTKRKRGFTDDEMKLALEKFAGKSLTLFYNNYINGAKPIDYAPYFAYAGLYIQNQNQGSNEPYLGINLSEEDGKLKIKTVIKGTSAYSAGLNAGDEVLAINQYRVDQKEFHKIIGMKAPDDKVSVMVARDGKVFTLEVLIQANPNVNYRLIKTPSPSPLQEKVYNKWLRKN